MDYEAATGRDRDAWFAILDTYGLEIDHTQRARLLADSHPDLPGWWCQNIVVEYERARGLRKLGQSSRGDFQLSCSKTVPIGVQQAWQRVLDGVVPDGPWEVGATWTVPEGDVQGATWAVPGSVEVRRVDPGKMLRWSWSSQEGRSTVEVAFGPKPGRTTVSLRHHGLPDAASRDRYRAHWRQALQALDG